MTITEKRKHPRVKTHNLVSYVCIDDNGNQTDEGMGSAIDISLYPQVKAIVSSGYSDDPVMTNFTVYGFTEILPKPYTKKELIEMLKKITKE